jgi:hypothetical protein
MHLSQARKAARFPGTRTSHDIEVVLGHLHQSLSSQSTALIKVLALDAYLGRVHVTIWERQRRVLTIHHLSTYAADQSRVGLMRHGHLFR